MELQASGIVGDFRGFSSVGNKAYVLTLNAGVVPNVESYLRLGHARMLVDAQYLRDQAAHCAALARTCPHRKTAQALEALGMELMEKAAELETNTALFPAKPDAP